MRMKDIFVIVMCVFVGIIVMMGVIVFILCLVGYRVVIEVKELVNVKVFVIFNYIVMLESGFCVFIVWYFYFRVFVLVQLLWNVNFDLGIYEDVIQCIMMFIMGGDLQL